MKPLATLENWFKLGDCYVGRVGNHPQQKQFTSTLQITSKVVAESQERATGDTIIETQNTFYRLGKPFGTPNEPEKV